MNSRKWPDQESVPVDRIGKTNWARVSITGKGAVGHRHLIDGFYGNNATARR